MSRINDLTQDFCNDIYEYDVYPNDELFQASVESEELIKDKNTKWYNNFKEIRNDLDV